jgi:arylformamidase
VVVWLMMTGMTEPVTLHDISPPLAPDLAVWPGDAPLSRELVADLRSGDVATVSTLRATVHLGAHLDAPSHYAPNGATIDACPLERFVGPCQVVRVATQPGARIQADALPATFTAPRVLIATGTYPDPTQFNEDFAGLHPSAVEHLAAAGVGLIGVDTPSVDRVADEDLPAHQACARTGVLILEGLRLERVPEATYELIALPLRLVGFDASPVRAVLRPLAGV